MSQTAQIGLENYTRAGDVAVIAICLVMGILLSTSYVSRTRSFRIFMHIIIVLVCAALVNIAYHSLLLGGYAPPGHLIHGMQVLYHALLFDAFFLFTLYTTVASGLEHRKARGIAITSCLLFIAIVGADVALALRGVGMRITETGATVHHTNLFMVGYVLYILMLAALMTQAKDLLYKRVMYGFYGTTAISVAIQFAQLALKQTSLTTMTFVFPVIAMLYTMHSNPYNVALGAVDVRAMEDMVRNLYTHKMPFLFVSFMLPDYDGEGKELPEQIRSVIRRFAGNYFRGCVMFQIGNGHGVLIAPLRRNPDYERRIEALLKEFRGQYRRFHFAYKIVIGQSVEEISRKNEYVSLIRSVQRTMEENTVCRIGPDEIAGFNRNEYILRELADIYNKKDMDDPRVLAFCQPVFNLRTGRFDTAEALMRLKLDGVGLVPPDQFIPLAESHGYIHRLTEIILHKTCREIRRLSEEGFQIGRVSVNVSVLELKDDAFCGDINRIISDNRITGEKIAIELTESRNEADFMLMKEKIDQLRRQGIQFYLDDFGTGYSNMERIMELPFDIIKFDRSLVIASGTDARSERIVENLAHLFRDMEYAVLYEGVEDDMDEERCREMSASYLQGYKYSRPVPIERLREYLPKAG